jgi:Mrp family chromosome partitioning ATPase
VSALLAEARSRFDIVLVDCPALLRVADAADLVSAADAVVIVANPGDRIADHLEMAERLKPIKSDVAGYLYNRAPARSYVAHHGGPMARPAPGTRAALVTAWPPDDESRTVPQPRPR